LYYLISQPIKENYQKLPVVVKKQSINHIIHDLITRKMKKKVRSASQEQLKARPDHKHHQRTQLKFHEAARLRNSLRRLSSTYEGSGTS